MKQRILELIWQYNTQGAFLGPEETFSVMVRGVFQVQERANNESISDFFFLIRLWKKYNFQLVSYSSFLLADSDAWSFIGASMQL